VGHIRIGVLPKTRKWRQVIGLLNSKESSTPDIAAEAANAAKEFLREKRFDSSLAFSYWLLTQITYRAKQDDFVSALRNIELDISKVSNSFDFVGQVADFSRNQIKKRGESFPFSDIAQLALREVLMESIGEESKSIFGTSLEDIKRACRKYSSPGQFSKLARLYFSKVFTRGLRFLIDKGSANNVGAGKRFDSIFDLAEFNVALEAYCYQSAKIVERFAEGWYSKRNWQGEISEKDAQGFVAIAVEKFQAEIARDN
jgi:hypothetical protein